jgi:3-hydroxy-9,10-secoandrosta-1,3,5(10)-triene-9,17-dione monooxygenase
MSDLPQRSFADVDFEEAVRRAHALIPVIKEHAAAVERATQLTPEVLRAIHDSGLFRMQQPKRFGGMELDFHAFTVIPEILGRGDASCGWNFINLASHHRQLAQWDPKAQEEIWGDNPDALIASGIAYHQGRARQVDGGLIINGTWGFSSGVDSSQWNMLACTVMDGDKPIDWCMCMIPVEDHEIIDDWKTLGMRGTGSRSVRCVDVFVPAHRALSMHVARSGHEFPGMRMHANPMFRVPTSALGGFGVGGALLGNAQAAVDATIELVRSRSTAYTGAKMRDFPTVQLRVGTAAAQVDAVRAWFRSDCLEGAATVARDGGLDLATKLRFRRNAAMGVKMATSAIDALHEVAGANGIYDDYPIQKIFRDAHAGGAHFVLNTDVQTTPWAIVAFGGEVKSPTL